jgi:hypothetical protein
VDVRIIDEDTGEVLGNGHEPGAQMLTEAVQTAASIEADMAEFTETPAATAAAPIETGQEDLPWADGPATTEERPKRPGYSNKIEFYALVVKWLPRYRSATDQAVANEFAVISSLKRVGITSLSDPRAWPHLCMRNDAEGGASA